MVLMNSLDQTAVTPSLENLVQLYNEMMLASYVAAPDWEGLEEDDEAVLLMSSIYMFFPKAEDDYKKIIQLLVYFLNEYGCYEEEVVQWKISELLGRAEVLVPLVKRQRRSARQWMLQATAELTPTAGY